MKHQLTATGGSEPALSTSPVSIKRPRHAVVSNAAFAEQPLLSSSSTTASPLTVPPAAHTAAVSGVSSAISTPSAAELKSSFRSFAASLPPACRELMNVTIPQQILTMHAYLQHMPPFQHSVRVPGEDTDTQPVDPITLPPVASSTDTVATAATLQASSDITSKGVSAPPVSVTPTFTRPPIVPLTSPLPAHPQLSTFLPFLHSTLSLLLVHLSTLKLNLQLLIPPSDDSNTFGVEIQTETLSHLTAYEDLAFAALERLVVYGSNRAKMVSKVVKWPGIADYWSSVRELDEGMYVDGRCTVMECREAYMAVLDLLRKNEERLNDPKGDRSKGDRFSMAM